MPNSKVISPKPWYLNHNDIAAMFTNGGEFNSIPTDSKFIAADIFEDAQDGGRITARKIKQVIDETNAKGEKIGAFLFCNPVNPTGLVTREDEWQKIVQVLETEKDAFILVDEAFAEVIFDCDFEHSILHAEHNLMDRIVLFRSGTKALGFPGERLAVMRVPDSILQIVTSFQGRLMGNPTLSSQAGLSKALETMTKDKKAKISKYYESNMEFVYKEIKNLNIANCVFKPEGGFYALYDFSKLKGLKLTDEAKEIAATNSDVISNDYEGNLEKMIEKLDRIKKFIS